MPSESPGDRDAEICTETSGGEKTVLNTYVRKPPDRDTVAADTRCVGTEYSDVKPTTTGCTFKRGGRCIIHGTMGAKFTDSIKVWTKKRDGLFGYVWKSKVRYECQYEGVAKSNESVSRSRGVTKSNGDPSNLGPGKMTENVEALVGMNYRDTGYLPGISGADYMMAGGKERESVKISGEQKDQG